MKIMLDAGHGPNTAGKRSPDGTLLEFQFNSAVADLCRDMLRKYKDVQTMFAHIPHSDEPLLNRVRKANEWAADVYVSIHANALGDGSEWNEGKGIETYTYTSEPKEAKNLAIEVQGQLLRNTGRYNRGVKSANFFVLKYTHMTAILVECGFMTNKEECALLKSDKYRVQCAAAIVTGLVNFYKLELTQENKEVQYIISGEKHKMTALAEELSCRGFELHIIE
jgi:N-acetylmuramoyl-L-alanine amidase